MSRIDKLKTLLARVEQRRAEPRLVAVSNASALASANTNVANLGIAPANLTTPAARAAQPALELAPKPTSSLDQAIAPLAPSSIPPPPSERPARPSSLPPLARAPAPPSSTVPPPLTQPTAPAAPPGATETLGRAATEVQPAAPVRIAPVPVAPSESAVRVTSAPRIEAPKTFGELLEQSLALRPKSG